MFGFIILLWCTCKSWYRFSPFSCWYIHLKGNLNASQAQTNHSLLLLLLSYFCKSFRLHLKSKMLHWCENCWQSYCTAEKLFLCLPFSLTEEYMKQFWNSGHTIQDHVIHPYPKYFFPIHNHKSQKNKRLCPKQPKMTIVLSEFDQFSPIRSVSVNYFHAIHVCEVPAGSLHAQGEEVSHVHAHNWLSWRNMCYGPKNTKAFFWHTHPVSKFQACLQ